MLNSIKDIIKDINKTETLRDKYRRKLDKIVSCVLDPRDLSFMLIDSEGNHYKYIYYSCEDVFCKFRYINGSYKDRTTISVEDFVSALEECLIDKLGREMNKTYNIVKLFKEITNNEKKRKKN